ncbi:toxin-antitoxin system YwqK family antitoxin [Owenweeksia hongkongensis]|uniref:toxin-antitoxin system YwqK family antitoxin n=1 Tax=Owenweeksia hongkongensis TaxID=253245 RepID=UPI003A956D56
MRFVIFLIIILSNTLSLCGQWDTSFTRGDTLTGRNYFHNGQLKYERMLINGRDFHSFLSSKLYFRNGNPRYLKHWDAKLDTSFSLNGNRNGSLSYKSYSSKNHNLEFQYDRKGLLIEIYKRSDDCVIIQSYEKGKLVSEETHPYQKPDKYLGTYPIIKHYEGQVGGTSAVIAVQKGTTTEYTVNGKKMTESDYLKYEEEYESYIASRRVVHLYQEYSRDSVLISEGLYKGDQHCGNFKEYHSDGKIVMLRGDYNNLGQKNGTWCLYDEDGLLIKRTTYNNGKIDE